MKENKTLLVNFFVCVRARVCVCVCVCVYASLCRVVMFSGKRPLKHDFVLFERIQPCNWILALN